MLLGRTEECSDARGVSELSTLKVNLRKFKSFRITNEWPKLRVPGEAEVGSTTADRCADSR